MISSQFSALLVDAPVDRHFAQLHRDSDTLVDSVGLFVETGLRRGNGVVIIATPGHTDPVLKRLAQQDLDPEACRRSGQLRVLDAEATLGCFMRRGMPDWTEFRRTVGTVLEEARAFAQSTTRAYGEMVNVLWRDGQVRAAIRLEEYWNELARMHPFSLFCGYMLDSQESETYTAPLHELGRTHTDIVATEQDERFRVALDAACKDIYGIPLSQLLSFSGQEDNPGEHRLPTGQRTMLWIMRNMPTSSSKILELARLYYQEPPR